MDIFDVTIDKNNLDDEWVTHPIKVAKISKLVADAERERDQKKYELEILEAELDKVARGESSKTTEAAIKNWIKLRPEYQKKCQELIDANYSLKVLQGAATARSHCKYALENLSRLFLADYYAEPYNPQLTETIIDRQIKKMNQVGSKTMRGRKNAKKEV
jgi:hypothetical protein